MTFFYERYLLKKEEQPAFVQQASPFEDFVVRCVRYAFANIPPKVGRVFFGKRVALPWLRWRLFRHGHLRSPIFWKEYKDERIRGVWAIHDPARRPDIIIYYAHGELFPTWFRIDWSLKMFKAEASAWAHPFSTSSFFLLGCRS